MSATRLIFHIHSQPRLADTDAQICTPSLRVRRAPFKVSHWAGSQQTADSFVSNVDFFSFYPQGQRNSADISGHRGGTGLGIQAIYMTRLNWPPHVAGIPIMCVMLRMNCRCCVHFQGFPNCCRQRKRKERKEEREGWKSVSAFEYV